MKIKEIEKKVKQLLCNNKENYKTNQTGYDNGYTDGYHDGVLFLAKLIGCNIDDDYIN